MPIRVPTADPLDWWRRALADPRTVRHDGEPQPGFYIRRAVKNGPFLPVEIRLVQVVDEETGELTEPERLEAHELGHRRNPFAIWLGLRPVTIPDFDAVVERHRVDDRMAATHAVYDVSETPMRPRR